MNSVSKMLIAAAFVATSAFAVLPAGASAVTVPECTAVAVGTKNSVTGPDAIFHVNGDKVSASYKLTGPANCKLTMELQSWQAPNPTDGKPYSAQKKIGSDLKTAGPGTYMLTTQFPNCYYQLDLVFHGTEKYSVRNIGYAHGGDHKCGEQPVKATTTSITPAPATPVAATPATPAVPAELPHTGPEAVLGTFLATSGAGTLAHRFVLSRKSRR